MTVDRPRISAVVLTQNVAAIIARCLSSLSFADEIVVVDADSSDDTPDLARRAGARVVSNPWPGFAAQRRVGLAEARHEWVFFCDSDEEVSPELAAEIQRAVDTADASTGGFRVRRRNQFLGRWIDHGPWAADFQLRLARRDQVEVTSQAVHEGLTTKRDVRVLHAPLYHYTHDTVYESVARLNRYTTLEAPDRVRRRRVGVLDPLVPPLGAFVRFYFFGGLWRYGARGYLLSAITAMYRSVLYVKVYSLQRRLEPGP